MLSDKPGRDFCTAAIRYLEKTVDHDCEMQELGVTGASGSETAADEERGGSNPSATLQLLKCFEILPKCGDWTFGPNDLHSVCSLRHGQALRTILQVSIALLVGIPCKPQVNKSTQSRL